MEDDFYATIKFKTGEEVFAKVAASEEEDRTMLIVSNPVTIDQIKSRSGLQGFKVEPWLKTTSEDMFVVDIADVLTLSESNDMEMIIMHQAYINNSNSFIKKNNKLDRKMGYISNVQDAKKILEKIYKNTKDNTEPKS
jgi:alpha/beta superfamily hydrolase